MATWFWSVPSSTDGKQCILMVQSRHSGARWDSNLSSTTSQVALPRRYLMGTQMLLMVMNPPASAGDARDVSSIPGLGRSPGGGHGNPLQYSCLENPMDRGAWQATVHGVEKSRTQLKRLSTHVTPSTSCVSGRNPFTFVSSSLERFWFFFKYLPLSISVKMIFVNYSEQSLVCIRYYGSVCSTKNAVSLGWAFLATGSDSPAPHPLSCLFLFPRYLPPSDNMKCTVLSPLL